MVAPGYVDTDMVRAVPADVLEKIIARIPVGRLGKAEDIARAVLFLASEDASFLTGLDLPVDGGFTEFGIYAQVWRRATGKRAT